MKQCACRFCLQALASEQLSFPVVYSPLDNGYDAREHSDSTVLHRDGGLLRKFLLQPLRYAVYRSLREPFAIRLQD
jgi:hypothetical protein